jgi:hypothetical protein
MKNTVDYSKMNDAESFYNAINDCKAYLGTKKFNEITALAKKEPVDLHTWANMLGMLAGIEGYPVKAWYQYIFGFDSTKEIEDVVVLGSSPAEIIIEMKQFISSVAWWMQGQEQYDVKNEVNQKIGEARILEERVKKSGV